MLTSFHARTQSAFHPTPSTESDRKVRLGAEASPPQDAGSAGRLVMTDGDPGAPGIRRAQLDQVGFKGKVGETLVLPQPKGPLTVLVGAGARGSLTVATLRDAAAAYARAAKQPRLAFSLANTEALPAEVAAQAVTEGVLLARYRYRPSGTREGREGEEPRLEALTLVADKDLEAVRKGVERGGIIARAAWLARDLSEAPASLLTATRMAELAVALGKQAGLEVEIFDGEALLELGCGGLLGVNAGSAEPPKMIRLRYRPAGGEQAVTGRVALVGKGIMFDSGGLGLKPNDLVHATMKSDMSGAGAIFAAMTALKALGATCEVTGYLMCTDNMPSGTAMRLGDILTIRGGKTVEVLNTDAEGRLVMADALVLATEQEPKPDAIVDIATLTGACQRALGTLTAGLFGNQEVLTEQLEAAAERTDETVWRLPLDRRLRKELDSTIADMKNVGGDFAGATTAALFLEEFVDGLPWAHLDIAGTARADRADAWRTKGATGYGTRLLIDFLMGFRPPALAQH